MPFKSMNTVIPLPKNKQTKKEVSRLKIMTCMKQKGNETKISTLERERERERERELVT